MNQFKNQLVSSRSSPGEPALIPLTDATTAVSYTDAGLTSSVGSCVTVDLVKLPVPVPDFPQPYQLGPPNF